LASALVVKKALFY